MQMEPEMKRERSSSVVETVTERLERAIITGELAAGARLTEHGLADRFGVSRGPLREALRRLEGRRLIVRTHNVGARVASLDINQVKEMLVVREALEGTAARLAARLMTDEEIETLMKVAEQQEKLERLDQYSPNFQGSYADFHARIAARTADTKAYDIYQGPELDFHARIVVGARNSRLYDMIYGDPFYMLRVYRYRSSMLPGRPAMAIAEHRAVAAAIAVRDPDTAEHVMRMHLRRSHDSIMEHLSALKGLAPSVEEGEAQTDV